MKRAFIDFLKQLAIGILLTILTPSAVLSIISRLTTGYWLALFQSIPAYIWFIVVIIIILALFVIKRYKMLRKENGLGIAFHYEPLYGWQDIGEYEYAGFIWRFQTPVTGLMMEYSDINPDSIEIVTPPRCPKCKTEIEEHRSFWGGYVWTCVRCGYRRRNRHSIYREADRVKKIVRRISEEKFKS